MYEKFFALPQEKQLKIINAGIEVFSRYEYKKASTEEIAYKAGISKSLLFHYFHNKKSFFIYLLDYTAKRFKEYVLDLEYQKETDFFKFLNYVSNERTDTLLSSPYTLNFLMRCYYSDKSTISDEVHQIIYQQISTSLETYLSHIDWSKFKDEVDEKEIFNMLLWLIEGYLCEKERMHETIDISDLIRHYELWASLLKQVSYKEEYL